MNLKIVLIRTTFHYFGALHYGMQSRIEQKKLYLYLFFLQQTWNLLCLRLFALVEP